MSILHIPFYFCWIMLILCLIDVLFKGSYTSAESFTKLNSYINNLSGGKQACRLFYLALPPSVFADVTKHIKEQCMNDGCVFTMQCILYCSCFALYQMLSFHSHYLGYVVRDFIYFSFIYTVIQNWSITFIFA